MNELVSLLPIIGIGLLFWLLIIRPQSRRQKALAALQGSLEPGHEVMLTSGLYGVVDRVVDDRIHLRVADGVVLEVARGAVANIIEANDGAAPTHESRHESGPESGSTPGA